MTTKKKHPANRDDLLNAWHNRSHESNASSIRISASLTREEDGTQSVNLLADDSDDSEGENENEMKSIDSDKTEDPRYPWDSKQKASKPKDRTETKLAAIQESPTTKTLNILSQNMDDLQCEPCFDDQNKRRLTMPSTTNTTTLPIRDLPQGYDLDWEIHSIRIVPHLKNSSSSPGRSQALGAVISREAFPMTVKSGVQRNHCVVKRLHEDGVAMRCGLKQGDWFLRPMDMTSLPQWSNGDLSSKILNSAIREYKTKSLPRLATFDEIQEWSKESFAEYRPIRVLRKKSVANKRASTPASITTSVSHTNTIHRELRTKPKSSKKNDDGIDNSQNSKSQKSDVPPYCVLCNYYNPSHWSKDSTYGKKRTKPSRAPRSHHAWCPQNKVFDAERVEKRLARMKHCYRTLGCGACHMEYQTGRVISVKKKMKNASDVDDVVHNEECRAYQRRIQREERRKREQGEEEERKKEEALKKRARADAKERKKNDEAQGKNATKRVKRNRYKRGVSNSSSSSDQSDEDVGCEDGSIYQPPTRKARIETLTYPRKKKDSKKPIQANNTKRSRNLDAVDEELRRFDAAMLQEKTGNEPEAKQITKKEDKPVWVPLYDNPWGGEGYQTGDVLLFGPQPGIGHHEAHLPSNQRYKVNPFSDDSTYRNTHCTPEEGLSLILLKRDPMGKMPWGFRTVRDEFGNACLVERVDPCSPASNATFLGVPASGVSEASTSALHVNDMVVLINGKPVGGMTEVGLELELEMTAPNLLLGVSRYKHAQEVAQRFAEMERKMLAFMDRATRDNRLMGWREIGCGNGPDSREEATRSVTKGLLPSQPESKEHNSSMLCETSQRINTGESSTNTKEQYDDSTNTSEHNFANRDNQTKISFTKDQDNRYHPMTPTAESFPMELEGDSNSFSESNEDSAAHDDNPQMGCVCGAKHSPSRINTFWIQCESCDSWYHAAKDCIGFNEKRANRPDFVWNCAVCTPVIENDEQVDPSDDKRDSIEIPNREKWREVCELPKNRSDNTTHSENQETHSNHENGGNRRSLPLTENHSNLPSTPQKHSESETTSEPTLPARQREKRPSTPLAVRELKSYNRNGSGYWENFESRTISSDSGRCLRKRGLATNKDEGKDKALKPSESKNKQRDTIRSEVVDETENLQKTSKTARNHSVRNLVMSKSERDDSSIASTVASGEAEVEATMPIKSFEVGDLVFVESHAWAYVDNSGGIGKIQKTYLSDDGDRVYDVKYPALGRTEKRIMPEYVSPYSFY